MCHILNINRSGFYAWLKKPLSKRAIEDNRLLSKIKQFWLESGCTYGYRNITIDLKNDGETCGKNRIYRIMRANKIRALRGYKRHRGFGNSKQHPAAPNTLNREFTVSQPDQACVTDFTYIRTYEGWLMGDPIGRIILCRTKHAYNLQLGDQYIKLSNRI